MVDTGKWLTLRKLPVQIWVFIEDIFQKVMRANTTTIFLWLQALHVSKIRNFKHSAAYKKKTYLRHKNID